jgi:hypothetical protein
MSEKEWHPCKRKDFIAKLKKLGFSDPEAVEIMNL